MGVGVSERPRAPRLRLDQAIDRLLRDRGLRRAAAAGADLGLTADDAALVRAIDPDELEQAARGLVRELLTRRHRGVGTLADVYPVTFAAFRAGFGGDVAGADDELAARLLASPAYDDHRVLTFAGGPGTCLEEAFFRFAEAEDVGDAAVRRGEFLRGMIRAIATADPPGFTIPPEIQRGPAGAWAMGPGARLYATAGGRVVEGPVPAHRLGLILAQLGLVDRDDGEDREGPCPPRPSAMR